ncbi:MAG: Pvc16 family protein [Tepidiformaceae bacterium]
MFSDVDETLRERLTADMPIHAAEIDIDFDRPNREWSSRLSKPTLNLFLFDVRERAEFRDQMRRVEPMREGQTIVARPPLRMDLSYVATAWTKEPGDEHRILARAMAAMYRASELVAPTLHGGLADGPLPLLTRVMTPDHLAKPADLWGVLDNDLHASITWVVTAPLSVWAAVTGPMVRTRELRFAQTGHEGTESFTQIAGIVHKRGDSTTTVGGVTVSVLGTTLTATTAEDGRFKFEGIRPGEYRVRVDGPEEASERNFTVPSPTYDLEV